MEYCRRILRVLIIGMLLFINSAGTEDGKSCAFKNLPGYHVRYPGYVYGLLVQELFHVLFGSGNRADIVILHKEGEHIG